MPRFRHIAHVAMDLDEIAFISYTEERRKISVCMKSGETKVIPCEDQGLAERIFHLLAVELHSRDLFREKPPEPKPPGPDL